MSSILSMPLELFPKRFIVLGDNLTTGIRQIGIRRLGTREDSSFILIRTNELSV